MPMFPCFSMTLAIVDHQSWFSLINIFMESLLSMSLSQFILFSITYNPILKTYLNSWPQWWFYCLNLKSRFSISNTGFCISKTVSDRDHRVLVTKWFPWIGQQFPWWVCRACNLLIEHLKTQEHSYYDKFLDTVVIFYYTRYQTTKRD